MEVERLTARRASEGGWLAGGVNTADGVDGWVTSTNAYPSKSKVGEPAPGGTNERAPAFLSWSTVVDTAPAWVVVERASLDGRRDRCGNPDQHPRHRASGSWGPDLAASRRGSERMRHWNPIVMVVTILLLGVTPVSSVRADDCEFVLGFATLRNLMPRIVGQCLENEHHNPANGDGLQRTANGLLVWRKSDNFTAFTDGSRTWVNGPFGLQQRLNGQRFFWEWNPDRLPIIPAPTPGDRCHTSALSLSREDGGAGAGHAGVTFRFTNNLPVPCTFFGYVGAQRLDAQSNLVPTNVVRGGGYMFQDPAPTLVTVPPGGSAIFGFEWGQVPVGDETTCPTSSQFVVTPPDEFAAIILPMTFTACGSGTIHVTAVRPVS